ncbi:MULTISPECIES: hypothetical protein [Sutcliffiella]|uniref:Uncharacterized protein n=1 Tax=Sutcliffiella cohnii TaxID=33932 RepID=A0A223KMV1_9BACI|nr:MULTISPECIES: hypothetical protein [Sutcliffiella]AST90653.1 hypothetical protein BC6307_04830 [Sutcliffiella cohnii]MED4016941.1 hypothetical protein [Sutcliffiella cohnii]WBL16305.1 hypothetical protein O1A01_06645 [Sutcliffiella sp. NC1]
MNKLDKHNQELLMLKQKDIHYRSEISRLSNAIVELENLIKKEQIRNQYLQKKLIEVENNKLLEYKKQIQKYKNALLEKEVALEEEQKKVETIMSEIITREIQPPPQQKENNDFALDSFFNYSTILSTYEVDQDIVIIGDYVIKNTGSTKIQDIIICIKLAPHNNCNFSGKITMNPELDQDEDMLNSKAATNWTYAVKDWKMKIRKDGEYWIRPINDSTLEPGEQLIFPQFELRIHKESNIKKNVIQGFTYSNEFRKGTPSNNQIIISY